MLAQSSLKEGSNGLFSGIRQLTHSGALYNYKLFGRIPTRLLGTPPEIFSGNPAAGQRLLSGSLVYAGRKYSLQTIIDSPSKIDRRCLEHFHGFDWLSDLRCVGNVPARSLAQVLISEWISNYSNWDSFYWRPEIIGARLVSWLTHFAFVTSNSQSMLLDKLYNELGRQSFHLFRTVLGSEPGKSRIVALKGLVFAGVVLPDSDKYLIRGLDNLEKEVARQIYLDGGHNSRSPELQMKVLRDLIEIREILSAAHIIIPTWLDDGIERMVPMLRAMRHGDGGLFLFHDGMSGDTTQIDLLLAKANVKGNALFSSPQSGYQRMSSGKTLLVIDVGTPPTQAHDEFRHAGALAFEMSMGRERLIVNCGSARHLTEEWRKALCAPAAHSTITIDEVDAGELGLSGKNSCVPTSVRSSRREFDGNLVVDAISNGYERAYGISHRRILMMSHDGLVVRGEDQLLGASQQKICLRFHLHPNVQVTLIQHGRAALIKPRRGPGWKFSALDRDITLEGSVYIEGSSRPRRTNQVVIKFTLQGCNTSVKWCLEKI